eukprot:scaffold412_cov311-Pavlova_lutheri.AAC.1
MILPKSRIAVLFPTVVYPCVWTGGILPSPRSLRLATLPTCPIRRSGSFLDLSNACIPALPPLPVWIGIWNQLGLALSSGCRFPGTVNPDGSRSWWIEGSCPMGGTKRPSGTPIAAKSRGWVRTRTCCAIRTS